jgi:hypothetical protein
MAAELKRKLATRVLAFTDGSGLAWPTKCIFGLDETKEGALRKIEALVFMRGISSDDHDTSAAKAEALQKVQVVTVQINDKQVTLVEKIDCVLAEVSCVLASAELRGELCVHCHVDMATSVELSEDYYCENCSCAWCAVCGPSEGIPIDEDEEDMLCASCASDPKV